jgi:uroporphyrinogen-III synthase
LTSSEVASAVVVLLHADILVQSAACVLTSATVVAIGRITKALVKKYGITDGDAA